jgi:hypothetical protein
MHNHRRHGSARHAAPLVLALLLVVSSSVKLPAIAQQSAGSVPASPAQVAPSPEASIPLDTSGVVAPEASSQSNGVTREAVPLFRLEKRPVGADAELLTIFGGAAGATVVGAPLEPTQGGTSAGVPLVSILRDTLGDERAENDRLRYVWMLTYTRPSARQRLASAIPLFYGRIGDKRHVATKGMPPPVIDLAVPERDVWRRFMWAALQNVIFNPYGLAAETSTGALRHNASQYRKAHLLRALAVISLYEAETGAASTFTPEEMRELQARLALADKTFGGFVGDLYLDSARRTYETQWLDERGHNWELLRQRAEAEGLYFEPMLMPDGGATHALIWVAREDLARHRGRKFNGRFLNIANPWSDERLRRWDGFAETWHLDAESRIVPAGTPGARSVEMIPLALYGLEHPKVPTLLVDFRDTSNPKRREMSHRVIEDVTRKVLSFSRFGDIHYFLGRAVFDFVTSRRGMDVNQPSRVRAYSQLKLLLSLDATLDRELRREIERRIERVSLNPLENGAGTEAEIARRQYEALVAYAAKPDGLAARLERERRSELVASSHGRASRVLFRLASALSLGLYKHREGLPRAELLAALDRERSLDYHLRFLKEVARSSPVVEVVWNIEDVRRSLRYVALANRRLDASTARLAAAIFARTEDEETRRLCLNCLYRIDNEEAKAELLRVYKLAELPPSLRELTARYLRDAVREEQRISREDAKAIAAALGQ